MASAKSVMALIKALKPAFGPDSDNDEVALAVHAYFLAYGYYLTATGPRALSSSALSSASTDEVGIENWNQLDDQYAFVYANPDTGFTKVLVKCLGMEDKLHVSCALADGSSKHVEIDVGIYVEENGSGNYSRQFKHMEMLVKTLDSLHPLSRKRKQLDTLWEENKIPANAINIPSAGSVKVGKLEGGKVSMQNVYSTRRVKQKIGSGSDEAVGLGILLEDKAIHEKEPHDIRKTFPNFPIPNAQLTTASDETGSVPVTQEFHLSSDQILPTPVKKMNPHHLQDGEVYPGRLRG